MLSAGAFVFRHSQSRNTANDVVEGRGAARSADPASVWLAERRRAAAAAAAGSGDSRDGLTSLSHNSHHRWRILEVWGGGRGRKRKKKNRNDELIIWKDLFYVFPPPRFLKGFFSPSWFAALPADPAPPSNRRAGSGKGFFSLFHALHPRGSALLTSHLHGRWRAPLSLECTQTSTYLSWWPRKTAWTPPLCMRCVCSQKVRRIFCSLSF